MIWGVTGFLPSTAKVEILPQPIPPAAQAGADQEETTAIYGGFHKWGYPKIDGFIVENPKREDDYIVHVHSN